MGSDYVPRHASGDGATGDGASGEGEGLAPAAEDGEAAENAARAEDVVQDETANDETVAGETTGTQDMGQRHEVEVSPPRVPMAARPPVGETDSEELELDAPEFWQEAGGVTAEEFLNLDTELGAAEAGHGESEDRFFDEANDGHEVEDSEARGRGRSGPVAGATSVFATRGTEGSGRPLGPGEELLIPAATSNRPPRNYGSFAPAEDEHEDDDDRGGWVPLVAALVAACVVAAIAFVIISDGEEEPDDRTEAASELPQTPAPSLGPIPTPTPLPTPVPTPTPTPYAGWSDPTQSGQPWSRVVEGILTFRGNPTRSWYGTGPMPTSPSVQWTYPEGRALCGNSTVGATTTQWCGTGWTGQPAVFEREDRTWAVFGAYDYGIHFVDADTGEDILPAFQTGDIIKGSVTIDPDGFPLVYSGSRDNFLHIVAFDREVPTELWRLSADAVQPQLWNNDWDGSPMVIGDYLFEGGENSVFHIVKLNRGYDDQGFVTVNPELVFFTPGWDQSLIDSVGINVSIENSVAVSGNTVYFANSGGLVQGWDITGLEDGAAPQQNFRYWVGDDTDATLVIDDEGFLYVGVEWERLNARSNEVGQLVKLDPSNPDNPLVWSVFLQAYANDGVWATPAIYKDMVYASSDAGRVIGVDRATGEVIWEKFLPGPVWSSQVVVDDVLLQGDCTGVMHAYDVSNTRIDPPEIWTVQVSDGCIESTPAVWGGRIIVGTRAGQVHMISDDPT